MNEEINEKVKGFINWLNDNDCYINSNLDIKYNDNDGYSIYSKGEINENEELISIDKKVCIDGKLCKTLLKEVNENIEDVNDEFILIAIYLSLHYIKNDLSVDVQSVLKHEKYVSILPCIDTINTSLYWNDDQLNLLKGTSLYEATCDRKRKWETDYQYICHLLRSITNKQTLTWSVYLHACTLITSRCFPSNLINDNNNDMPSSSIMIPYWDLLNHKFKSPINWLDAKYTKTAKIKMTIPIKINENDQVFNNYGPKSSHELLLSYAFIDNSNLEVDFVPFKIGINLSNFDDEKFNQLSKLNLLDENDNKKLKTFNLYYNKKINKSLIDMMTIIGKNVVEDDDLIDFVYDSLIDLLQSKLNNIINNYNQIEDNSLIEDYLFNQIKILKSNLKQLEEE